MWSTLSSTCSTSKECIREGRRSFGDWEASERGPDPIIDLLKEQGQNEKSPEGDGP